MDWKEVFSDYEEIKPGYWSKYGEIIQYETEERDKRRVEIGLYKEPDDGSYTIQIFYNGSVILCDNLV